MSKLKSSSSSKVNNESVKPLDDIIYKIKHLVNNKVDTIYVFYGKKEKDIEEESFIKNIFTDKEYDEIKANKTKIIFSEQRIHSDDSIATIKIKILNEMKNKDISLDERKSVV